MKDLIFSLLPIIVLQLVALVAALFVHIQSPGRDVVKVLVVPLALSCVLACPLLFTYLMGYAVSWPLPDKFTFIAYNPVIKSGHKTALEIWLKEGNTTRLQMAPYSKELEQMLQDAAKGKKAGRQAQISKRKPGQPGRPGEENKGKAEYELKFQSPGDIPKDMPSGLPRPQPEPQEDEPVTKRYSI